MYFLVILITFFKFYFNKTKKRRALWHRICFQYVCQPSDYTNHFINIIPQEIDPVYKQDDKDFTRVRELPFPKLIAFTLHLAASGTNRGVDIKSEQFFKNARRSGLWPYASAVHRSSVSKARKKVPWQVFTDILSDAVRVAYDLWPEDDSKYLWHGMSVYALDGSKYNLPVTDALREKYDPDSGLQNKGKGHYPQCLVSTYYDVFRQLPIARTVVGIDGSEREEMKKLLPYLPPNSISMFDRGYPSYESVLYLNEHYDGYYNFRCPASCTFPAVEAFVSSGKKEDTIWIMPSNKFKQKVGIKEKSKLKPIKLRVIRLESPDGTVSVLLTNMFNKKKYTCDEIIDLYFKRWEVENYYRDEKVTMEIEKFHAKKENGILQELYAAMIMSVITRTVMMLSSQLVYSGKRELQFKNAIIELASEAAFLVPEEADRAIIIFKEIIKAVARVKHHVSKKTRPSQPRVNKSPLNKWQQNRKEKLAAYA